ncbi:nucleoside permease [Albibacterium indicum]|uniref:nucleoside permease n=1 Tax=Albibacterium indicum TaxID=2292082 RepID=UPI000E47BD6A|nr:nucleoside permease [Pedobacter indicus]
MNAGIRFKLSFMMFLEFFVWGGWFVTLGTFLSQNLQASGPETANVFSTQSWGAIIAPFIIGLIADRYFNAERILGVLHIVGAILMYQMYTAPDVSVFFPYALGYMIIYMPTLALVNSISFRQMDNPEKNFSAIRVWGTIGWIAAGLAISYIFQWDSQPGALKYTFLMAGVGSLILGLFSFILPKTPPIKKNSEEKSTISEILGLDAMKLLKDRNFLIFFISSILICIPLAFYYQNANLFLNEIGMENPTGKMTIGQISEALFLLLLPLFFTKFGFKKTILIGMLAWVIRYVLFAYGNVNELSYMLIIGIALHGVCYDFFFVSGQIYTDSKAGEKYKSSAQGLITLATYGIGQLIGFQVAGVVSEHYQGLATAEFWHSVWLIPAAIAGAVFLIFLISFRNEKTEAPVLEQ